MQTIRIFESNKADGLEDEIRGWLEENQKYKIESVSFQTQHSSGGEFPWSIYTALVIFQPEDEEYYT